MIRKMATVSRAMIKWLTVGAIAAMTLPAAAAIVVHTSDFIADQNRTGFNGFEGISVGIYKSPTYTEGGITVEHVGPFGEVWTYMHTNTDRLHFEGDRSWNPVSTDNLGLTNDGYQRIRLASGASFDAIGFLAGSGYDYYCDTNCDEFLPQANMYYELFNAGVSVASGTLQHKSNAHYVGFSGGGFDEVRVWDSGTGYWAGRSAIALDSIEVVAAAVPEPATALLTLAGLVVMARTRRQRQAARQ
ncbi:MAG: PEP-CTERM sorting domain-containing protein [Rubrivivax sp.]|nr:MAG: PEP-CTERM sorting domain-containing protein [Rubrivivax sp.]